MSKLKILYIDEAGNTGLDLNNSQQPIFTIGGIVVDESDWYKLNHYIQQMKEKISPELTSSEIHASDIFNSSKNVKKGFDFRKNDYKYNLKILEDIVDLIVSLKPILFCFNINKSTYLEKLNLYIYKTTYIKQKIEPYTFSFGRIIRDYNEYLKNNNCNGMIFRDEIRSVEEEIEYLYETYSTNNDFSNIIESALSLDSKKSNFIQIADICNFYINKYYCITLFDKINNPLKKEHCLKQFEKLKPFIHFIDENIFL